MEAWLTALENRLRQTERALVVERLARQSAEVAQQTVGTWPAGVDVEEIGTLPMFSGDVDLSEQSDSVPWSQWSLTIRSYFGKFNRTTTWMLQQVETSVDCSKYCNDVHALVLQHNLCIGSNPLCHPFSRFPPCAPRISFGQHELRVPLFLIPC